MEQQTGILTEEAVERAENIRETFEEELWRMHDYQIDKARRNRRRLANLGLALWVIFLLIKWITAGKRAKEEGKAVGQCFNQNMEQTAERLRKWRYALLGAGVTFWIYILRPVVSYGMLFGLNGKEKVYTAYGISAVITAIAAYLLEISDGKRYIGKSRIKAVLQVISGCIVMLSGIRMGIIMASDFYPDEWSFYAINFGAEAMSLFLLNIIMKIMCKKNRNQYNEF